MSSENTQCAVDSGPGAGGLQKIQQAAHPGLLLSRLTSAKLLSITLSWLRATHIHPEDSQPRSGDTAAATHGEGQQLIGMTEEDQVLHRATNMAGWGG